MEYSKVLICTLCLLLQWDISDEKCVQISPSPEEGPVCGSDGKTYTNQLNMELLSCNYSLNITVLQKGPCRYCNITKCPVYSYCDRNVSGGVCLCSPYPEIYAPVCGDDGRTYDSEHHLNYEDCVDGRKNTSVIYRGTCKNEKCIHTSPPPQEGPVCGNDGKTYTNQLNMERLSCNYSLNITVLQKGPCRYCNITKCPVHSYCDRNVRGGVCLCSPYPEIYAPVCGDDGRTYDSEHHLNYEDCIDGRKNTSVIYRGTCKRIIVMDEKLYYIIIPAVAGFVLLMVIVFTVICCCRRRKDKALRNKGPSDLEYEVPLM